MSCKARKREIRKAKAAYGAAWHESVPQAPTPCRSVLSLALLSLIPFLR